jgi:hypothetical protein
MAKGKKTGGRTAGTENKTTASMKQCVQSTLEWLQTQPRVNMREWAKENPTEFYKISSKLIPTELNANVEIVKAELPEFMKSNESKS